MAITATERTNILKLIVGMFNAAPGAIYFPEIVAVYEASARNLNTLAIKLSGTGAFKELYPNTLIASEFADRFLTPLGLENDAQARAYVEGRFTAGANPGDIMHDALALIEATPLAAYDNAQAILANKAAVALHFSVTAGIMETDLAALQAVLAGVTADPQSVTDAIFGIDNPPQSFNLTINPDTFTGGAGNDVFTANLHLSTVDLILRPTLGGADELEGGGGDDTLNAVVNEYFGLAAGFDPQIGGIENHNYQVRDTDGSDSTVWIDYSHVTGMNNLFMRNSDDGSVLMVDEIQGPTNLGMTNQETTAFYAMFDEDALGSDDASQTITIQDVMDSYMSVSTFGDDVITNVMLNVVGGGDNELMLDVKADGIDSSIIDLLISGNGSLHLRNGWDFENLVTLDSTGLSGDLNINIRDSLDVMSVMTGPGDDFVRISRHIWDGETAVAVDLGAGDNTLSMGRWPGLSGSDINMIDFSGATLSNVQTLQFFTDLTLGEDTTLDVSTIGGLNTVNLTGSLWGGNFDFDLTGPAALTLAVDSEIDGLDLMTTGIMDLTISTGDGDLDLDSLTSDDVTALTVDADNNANVMLDGTDDNLITLSTVNVAAGNDATVTIAGEAGAPAVPPGIATTETGTITFTGFSEDKSVSKNFAGSVLVQSADLPGGQLLVSVTGSNNVSQIATAVAAAIEAAAGIGATSKAGVVTYTWDTTGPRGDIVATFIPSDDADAVASAEVVTQQGAAATPAIPAGDGTGFEGLTAVNVTADDEIVVNITDAYGAFTVTMVGGDDIEFDMTNAGATSVVADAADYADLDIINAEDLTSVTIIAGDDEGFSHLYLENTDSVATIDLSGITDNDTDDAVNGYIWVEVYDADFAGPVQVLIGTADVDYDSDDLNEVRETFTFTGEDTGEVVLNGFLASVGGTGDRLDFSQMAGIDNLDDLSITFDGDTHITSLVAGIDVNITVTGTDLSLDAFHFQF